MCGIVGAFRPDGAVSAADVIARMRDRMSHRGPDGCGLWASPDRKCAFGHRRLSIIDLSDAAAPPMSNAAAPVHLAFIVTPAPLTLFKGIFKLPAGHILTIDHRGEAKACEYWDCKPNRSTMIRESDMSEADAVAELTKLLKRSIARRMVSDVPFGVL